MSAHSSESKGDAFGSHSCLSSYIVNAPEQKSQSALQTIWTSLQQAHPKPLMEMLQPIWLAWHRLKHVCF